MQPEARSFTWDESAQLPSLGKEGVRMERHWLAWLGKEVASPLVVPVIVFVVRGNLLSFSCLVCLVGNIMDYERNLATGGIVDGSMGGISR